MDPRIQTRKQHLSNRFHRMLVRPDVSGCYIKKGHKSKCLHMFETKSHRLLQNLSKLCYAMCIVNQQEFLTFPKFISSGTIFSTFEELVL